MKIKHAYSDSGQNNPVTDPFPSHQYPHFFLNVKVIGKRNQILKLGKQKVLFFSVVVFFHTPTH